MRTDADESLERVLERLEESLQVDLIATYEPASCSPEEQARRILADPDLIRFDQFPVSDDRGRVVGILERQEVCPAADVLVKAVMRPLDDSIVIASSTGLLSYIRLATESPYHLVVRGHRISGIVTPSDLLKLPVRAVLFTLITHLESSMARVIRRQFPGETWLGLLSSGRREKLDAEFARLESLRREPDKLLLTQFCDKRDILSSRLERNDARRFARDMRELERLRNDVMHSNEYPSDPRYLQAQVESARTWIIWLDGQSLPPRLPKT